MIYFGVAMSLGGIMWGVICNILGLIIESLIPLGYGVLTIINFSLFNQFKNFKSARTFQILISLLLPFMFQFVLGGFIASGGVMLWSLISLVISLTFVTLRQGIFWLSFYILFTIIIGMLHPYMPRPFESTPFQSNLFFVINISVISAIVFALTLYFVQSRHKMLQRLEAANNSKSEFMANVSHELRTPLNGIIGFSDLLMKSPLNETQIKYNSVVHSSANTLLTLINDILDFSKVQAGKIELKEERVNIYDLCNEVMSVVYLQAKNKNIELLTDFSHGCPHFVWVDAERLKQILLNLVSNAVKFTNKGYVKLYVESYQILSNSLTTIQFSVEDTGIGIAPENHKKIFEAFVQEDSSTTKKYGGTGLGLTIANGLLKLMNSELNLKSDVHKGSTFYFYLNVVSQNQ